MDIIGFWNKGCDCFSLAYCKREHALTLFKKSRNVMIAVPLIIVTNSYCQYSLIYFSQRYHWLCYQFQALIILFPFCHSGKPAIGRADPPVVPVTDEVLVLMLIICCSCLSIQNQNVMFMISFVMMSLII